MRRILMAGLGATAALAFAVAPAAEAQAQTYPSYCGGKLQAASFYSTTTNQNVTYAAAFNATQARNRPNGTQFATLRGWGTSPSILLGIDTLNNPGGTGALSNMNDLPPATRVTCR